MDSDPDTVVRRPPRDARRRKGIIGMKILGRGELRNRQDEALPLRLSL